MARCVCAVLLASALTIGCGSNISAPNPRARVVESCRDFVPNDSVIDALISSVQANQDNGLSYGESMLDVTAGCETGCTFDECVVICYTCATAVTDYVYGR